MSDARPRRSPYKGARINHDYLERGQEIVGVNRSELEDILDFDLIESVFSGVGLFLLSGALWLVVQQLAEKWEMTILVAVCIPCVLFGMMLLGAGGFMRLKKRGKIERIFNETRVIGTQIE